LLLSEIRGLRNSGQRGNGARVIWNCVLESATMIFTKRKEPHTIQCGAEVTLADLIRDNVIYT
jgi:hypothetical protein